MKNFSVLIATILFFLPSLTIYACSCAYSEPPTAFNEAEAVFIGKMLGGTEKFSVEYEKGKKQELEAGMVKFKTLENFKGNISEEITIAISSMRGTSCGDYGLISGETYLVYAYSYETKDNKFLSSGVCTRTAPIKGKEVKEDLKFLRNLPPIGTGGNLEGRIWLDNKKMYGGGAKPLSNIKLKITGEDGNSRTVISNKNGDFQLNKIRAGKYRVEPILPKHLFVEDDFEEVTVADRGTAQVRFEAYFKGTIIGKSFDKNGIGYDSLSLRLASTGKIEREIYGHSDNEKGDFSVEGIPPGNYILYIELDHEDYNKNRKYYYPGTFDRKKAKIIKIGLGEKVEGINFPLPDEYQIRSIEGQVFFADGKPAAKTEVLLLCPQNSKPNGFTIESGAVSTETDENGNFKMLGFKGTSYWLESRSEKDGSRYSPLNKITLDKDLKNIKLVLSETGFSGSCGEKPS
ncbi:MAG: carboxypeptidase-like regulatory domain-containing protein [Pyrinomonadaceae bacterium]|nr:carboxypeptidase-like regulatory domain-containing protein [Pyrinomonadaceae bacterium]